MLQNIINLYFIIRFGDFQLKINKIKIYSNINLFKTALEKNSIKYSLLYLNDFVLNTVSIRYIRQFIILYYM